VETGAGEGPVSGGWISAVAFLPEAHPHMRVIVRARISGYIKRVFGVNFLPEKGYL
jgi:hypothetical protein